MTLDQIFIAALSLGGGFFSGWLLRQYYLNRNKIEQRGIIKDELGRLRTSSEISRLMPLRTEVIWNAIKSGAIVDVEDNIKNSLFLLLEDINNLNNLLDLWRTNIGNRDGQLFIANEEGQNLVAIQTVINQVFDRINARIDEIIRMKW